MRINIPKHKAIVFIYKLNYTSDDYVFHYYKCITLMCAPEYGKPKYLTSKVGSLFKNFLFIASEEFSSLQPIPLYSNISYLGDMPDK